MTITIAQFDSQIKTTLKAGDTRYVLPLAVDAHGVATRTTNTTNDFSFLQSLSSSQTPAVEARAFVPANNDVIPAVPAVPATPYVPAGNTFTKAAFQGTNILLVANKVKFDAGVTAHSGIEVTV